MVKAVKHILAKSLHAHILLTIKIQQMLFNDGMMLFKDMIYDIMTAENIEKMEMILSSDQDPLEMANAVHARSIRNGKSSKSWKNAWAY